MPLDGPFNPQQGSGKLLESDFISEPGLPDWMQLQLWGSHLRKRHSEEETGESGNPNSWPQIDLLCLASVRFSFPAYFGLGQGRVCYSLLAEIFLITSDKSFVVGVFFPFDSQQATQSHGITSLGLPHREGTIKKIQMVSHGPRPVLRSEIAGLEQKARYPGKTSPKSPCREWNQGAYPNIFKQKC